jgi:ribose 1,5-bisphosphate isomerase
MKQADNFVRDYLSPDAQKLFDDIVTQKVLGASVHIKMIAQMMRNLCSTAQAQNESVYILNAKILKLSEFFIKNRGEASQAITNAITIMVKGCNDKINGSIGAYIGHILHQIDEFERQNWHNLELVNQYAQSILSKMDTILVFDYSSTVARMIETCNHPLEIFIPESRAFDGGKPYVPHALKAHHKVHCIPDVAIYFFLYKCDGVFIGSETHYPDGRVFNTVGTDMVASLCNAFGIPFYVLTTLIKTDKRSIYGFVKHPLTLDLRDKISLDLDNQIKDQIDYSCPEVVEIPSRYVTAFITEAGIIPPSAMFQLSLNYLKEIGEISNNAEHL